MNAHSWELAAHPRGHSSPRTRATVIARWEDRRVLLELATGATVEAEVPVELQAHCDVGEEAWVQLAPGGSLTAWGLLKAAD